MQKFLVSGKDGDHLPYTDDKGKISHSHMGAAWAALHGGYRGNKYTGAGKSAAIAKLKALYKAEKMATPQESFSVPEHGASLLFEADGTTQKSGSFDAIRNRIQAALDNARNAGADLDLDGDNDAGYNGCCCWVMDVFPTSVVYSMDGDLFQCDYSDNGETVTLGKPVEVEQSYTVVPADAAADGEESVKESATRTGEVPRTLAIEAEELKEAGYDAAKGTLTVTVIKPGFSKNSTKINGKSLPRYYPAATLKRHHKLFSGSKMFADHQTESEAKSRPEGSVRDWVANLGEAWVDESDGSVKASATVIDPVFKAKLDLLNEKHLLKEMKTSVRIAAGLSEGQAEGKDAAIVESIFSNRSVDFVTFAGAGGQVEAMESAAAADDVDVISLQELSERRPDLIELIESRFHQEKETMKTLEQQLQEANENLKTATKEIETLKTKLTEATTDNDPVSPKKFNALKSENEKLIKENEELKTGQQKRDAATKLAELLTESKLPEAAKKRLQERFKDATSDEDMKEAIGEEREYIKSLGGKAEVKNLGEAHRATENVDHKATLIEGFKNMGMTEEQAKIAAAGRAH
jgi:hypothetical protein